MSPKDFKELMQAQKAVQLAEDALYPKMEAFRNAVKQWFWLKNPSLKEKHLEVDYSMGCSSCQGKVEEVWMTIWVTYKIDSSFFSLDDDGPREVTQRFTPEQIFGWGLPDLEKIGVKFK